MITKKDVKIGETYAAKVSRRAVPIRIDGPSPYGNGWLATNLRTKRQVIIRSARRLRGWWDTKNRRWVEARDFNSSIKT